MFLEYNRKPGYKTDSDSDDLIKSQKYPHFGVRMFYARKKNNVPVLRIFYQCFADFMPKYQIDVFFLFLDGFLR